MAKVFVCSSCGAQVTVDDGSHLGVGQCPARPQGLFSGGHQWRCVGTLSLNRGDATGAAHTAEPEFAGAHSGLETAVGLVVILAIGIPVLAFMLDAVLMVFGLGGFPLTGFLIKIIAFLIS